tara:strand:+ start:1130 stop:1276 length:147 start_codon:yes stop_codon:yes gene_type:complete
MFNLIIGILTGLLICVITLSFYPVIDTDIVCQKCNSQQWWFVPAKENK